MARPYSKQTIRDAVLLCLACADESARIEATLCLGCVIAHGTDEIARQLGLRWSSTAYNLANEAYDAIGAPKGYRDSIATWLNAAALIESGWRVGDEVPLLAKKPPVEEEIIDGRTVDTRDEATVEADAKFLADENAKADAATFASIRAREFAEGNAAMDAKEKALDEHGYGGAPPPGNLLALVADEPVAQRELEPTVVAADGWDDRAGEYGADS